MARLDKTILTTAETAKLIGVSTRTAQLLIEGGSIPSWKTPGGHRRVYRSDVMALVEGHAAEPESTSANVVVIAEHGRMAEYQRVFDGASGFKLVMFEDILAALVAVGSLKPQAILIDAGPEAPDRRPLLRSLASNPAIAGISIFLIGARASAPSGHATRGDAVDTPEAALTAIVAALETSGNNGAAMVEEGVPVALNEAQRLIALDRSGLLDSAPEDAFDRLTWLASQILDTPISLMTLLAASRQWFKSRVGLDVAETPRSWAFCNHTILQRELFVVEDLATDLRFADNPAVAGEAGFRFYAGAPIFDEHGFAVGSLCVIDRRPRTLDKREGQILTMLAAIASDELRLRAFDQRANAGPVGAKYAGRSAQSDAARTI